LQNVLWINIPFGRNDGDDTLVLTFWNQSVQRAAGLNMDGNARRPSEPHNVDIPMILPGDHQFQQWSVAGAQGFADSMNSVEHLIPLTVSSDWCHLDDPRW
jgi:hypothetical protein